MTHLHIPVPAITRGTLARTHELKTVLINLVPRVSLGREDERPWERGWVLIGYKVK